MQTTNGTQSVLFVVLIIASISLVRRGRRDPYVAYLAPRQRVRPLALEWIDPLLALVVVGPTLWHEVRLGVVPSVGALIGVGIGAGIGVLRSRVQFVRALRTTTSVVLTRSRTEYLLVIVLILLRSGENYLRTERGTFLTSLLALVLAVALSESIVRSYAITQKYRNDKLQPLVEPPL